MNVDKKTNLLRESASQPIKTMKAKHIFLTLCGLLFGSVSFAQVKIGDNPGTLAPNTVLHVEKASNHVVVSTSGNVGIGTLTPAAKLDVVGTIHAVGEVTIKKADAVEGGQIRLTSGTSANDWVVDQYEGATPSLNPRFRIFNGTDERIGINILENGNVGIGTSAPQEKLHVLGGVTSSVGSFTGALWNGTASTDGAALYANGALVAQRSSGANVAIGKPAGYTNGTYIAFAVANSLVGSVVYNGTVMQYNTTSDVRLKTGIRPTRYALQDLMRIEVKDYTYKADKTHKAQTGFIAQQLHTVYPNAVTVGGADEKANPWQVDYAKVTPLLVKAIQDQQAEIEALKTQNARLQSASAQATAQYNDLKAEVASIKALLQTLPSSVPAMANPASGK
jgi:FtsZ-binding cell division protein ZapB